MVKANPKEWPDYETQELYVIPADQMLVPRDLLERVTKDYSGNRTGTPWSLIAWQQWKSSRPGLSHLNHPFTSPSCALHFPMSGVIV